MSVVPGSRQVCLSDTLKSTNRNQGSFRSARSEVESRGASPNPLRKSLRGCILHDDAGTSLRLISALLLDTELQLL